MIEIKRIRENHLQIQCTSEFDYLTRIVDELEDFLDALIDDDELNYKVVLLMTEAITNAMEHGNELVSSKKVHVNLIVRPEHISIDVEDEGDGFDRNVLGDPTDSENILRDGGRGIFLIEQIADEVHFEKGGSLVKIVFHRG